MIKKNDELEVTISELTYAGLGFVKINEFPVFIYNALPDEKVKIKILKVLKKYAFARVLEFYSLSSDRNQDLDYSYLQTGLAPLSHLKYPAQLIFKQNQLKETLHKFGINENIEPIVASPESMHYRNKSQIPVRSVKGQLEVGFFRSHSHHLVPTEDFLLQEPIIDKNTILIRDILREEQIPPYDEENQSGVIRNIMFRYGKFSKELMLVLVVNKKKIPSISNLTAKIKARCPEITSFIINYNLKNTNVILGPKNQVIFGADYLTDKILENTFKISPLSFYQVNPLQTENLYKIAAKFGDLKETDIVMDAYSGIGTIGNTLANQVKQVIGVESIPEAVEDAKENAKINQHKNIRYDLGKAEEVIDKWIEEGIKVNKIFVDPPRKGLALNFIDQSVKMQPKMIIYVSCNPATLGRDLSLYQERGYQIKKIQPVDMFPQTAHIETIVLLQDAKS
ncbi:23S rRNA (uracil(1939)-C(5))-methyltransferase RlmD [Xylocopilactobacillus apis]|uniref:23S rRNA (Uracil-5-)-methyltransferase RumA n=1 Tax=Xylocopilactobacillus apis TaxID=2932183 RepID=A0AAU9DI77_9LACO|nr:23S rRNA (uracil(1939)-C(5))-methyltransferase RlmD [Xylocopilactobacillus apis]BDR56442.1 23S rRNA (uracil-5-)-methyltransferase RumA [Xylocopilactobacillus apis]